jgi:hypothetical protein
LIVGIKDYTGSAAHDTDIDTADADLDTLALVKKYAKRRETAHLFNYASMAHNNHFFFHRLVSFSSPSYQDQSLTIISA